MFPSFNVKFKTNLCKNFVAGLGCQRGARCHFAHGDTELRKENDVLNYTLNPNIAFAKYVCGRSVQVAAVLLQLALLQL
jgi:hypothetical protein